MANKLELTWYGKELGHSEKKNPQPLKAGDFCMPYLLLG